MLKIVNNNITEVTLLEISLDFIGINGLGFVVIDDPDVKT